MDHHDHPATVVDHRAVIVAESERFADAVGAGAADAPVAACPGWTLRDLGAHVGDVQRWAATVIATGKGDPNEYEIGDSPVGDWVRGGTQMLLDAIDASNPTDECWNLWDGSEKTMRFWYRRQALEVAVHRWDAQQAGTGHGEPIDPAVAADVIDEWVHTLLGRKLVQAEVDLTQMVGDVHLHCTDTAGEWTFEAIDGQLVVTDEHRKSAVAARGPASDLALLAYGRGDRSGVEIFGDTDLLDRWLVALT